MGRTQFNRFLSQLLTVGLLAAPIIIVTGCGYTREGGYANVNPAFFDAHGALRAPTGIVPGYNTLKTLIFQNECISCHGDKGGVNLSSYGGAKSAMAQLQDVMHNNPPMPPGKGTTSVEKQLIQSWIDAGGPEVDVATPAEKKCVLSTANVDPDFVDLATCSVVLPEGKIPGYNTVRELVFSTKCLSCHTGAKARKKVKLDTYADTTNFIDKIAHEVYVEKSMPPKRHGGPLPENEQEFVKAWIQGGAALEDQVVEPPVDPAFLDANGKPVLPPNKIPGFSTLKTLVFDKHCLRCHTGETARKGVRLDTYKDAKTFMAKIGSEVAGEHMPPKRAQAKGNKLSEAEKALVKAWVDAQGPAYDQTVSSRPSTENQ